MASHLLPSAPHASDAPADRRAPGSRLARNVAAWLRVMREVAHDAQDMRREARRRYPLSEG